MKKTLTVYFSPNDDSLIGEVWPKRPKAKTVLERKINEIDILQLNLKNSRNQVYRLSMTPDEAQEVAITLLNMVYGYMMFGDKTIKKEFLDKKKALLKKYSFKPKKVKGEQL